MSYEQEDHYGFFVTPRWLEPAETEDDMPNPGAKRFIEAPKKPYTKPRFYSCDEMPVEVDGVQFFDLPPIPTPRLVSDTDWDSVEACRRESVAKLDRSERKRLFIGVFWGVLVIVGALALLAGAVQGVQALYKAILP